MPLSPTFNNTSPALGSLNTPAEVLRNKAALAGTGTPGTPNQTQNEV